MDEVLEFLKNNPTYYLATVDAEGNPQVRPFGTIAKIDGKLYIQTGNVKRVYHEMKEHPRIAICAMSPDDVWLRIEADAITDHRIEPKRALLDEYPDLQGMYRADDGVTEVLALENVTATFYSFVSEPRTLTF